MFIVYRKYDASLLQSSLQNIQLQSQTKLTLEVGTELEESKLFIFYDNNPIARKDNLSIYKYIVSNDDEQGLEKGKYIYAIAFANRKRIHSNGSVNRFSENEIDILNKHWNNYFDGKNFTLKFFNADLNILKQIASAINIKFQGIEKVELPVKSLNLDDNQVLLHGSSQNTGLLASLINNMKSTKESVNAKKLGQIRKNELLKKEVTKQNMHEVHMKKIKSIRVANELTEEDRERIMKHASAKTKPKVEVEGTEEIDISQITLT